ncbi:MAG: hypothetical protein H7237_03740 [Alkalinema sp. FL-bin-369]|nr:hypothetical protein [Leptolyngbyaceae cyanobacterium LF-bin-369]
MGVTGSNPVTSIARSALTETDRACTLLSQPGQTRSKTANRSPLLCTDWVRGISGHSDRGYQPKTIKKPSQTINGFFDGRAQTQSQRGPKPSNPKDHQFRLSLWAF